MASRAAKAGAKPAAVRVVVRLRPLLPHEKTSKDKPCVRLEHSASGTRSRPDSVRLTETVSNTFGGKATTNDFIYNFDSCYGEDSTQKQLFDNEIRASIEKAFDGFNTTVLAYGMTSSGKTFTMQGTPDRTGVIPRTVECVLSKSNKLEKASPGLRVAVSLQYCEIFKDKVYDLLQPKDRDLSVRETAEGRIVVAQLAEMPIQSLADFQTLYDKGCQNRRTGATNLNKNSSRSHAVVMLQITFRETKEPFRLVKSKLHLIDLAGSEDNRMTGNKGDRLTESGSINKSLFVLGNVINSLNAGHNRIPFRDSKITRLLQDSLGGRSYATMIINIAPSSRHFLTTYATLNFGSKSRNIVNRVEQNLVNERELAKENSQSDVRRHSEGQESKEASPTGKPRSKSVDGTEADHTRQEVSKRKRSDKSSSTATTSPAKTSKRARKVNDASSRILASSASTQSMERLQDKLSAITNINTHNLAKTFIIEAKDRRKEGDIEGALALYQACATMLPDNQKLRSKVAQLEKERETLVLNKVSIDTLLSPERKPSRARPRSVRGHGAGASNRGSTCESDSRSVAASSASISQVSGDSDPSSSMNRVLMDLNSADEKTLLQYARVGKATATQIVRARALHRFESINDLSKIGKSEKWIAAFVTQNSFF